jgi:hypothetical protein
MNQGRDNPLVQALVGTDEDMPPLRMRTCTIMAINKAVTPWVATIRLGQIEVPNVTMLGWYDPRVGDIVKVAQQGSELLIWGPLSPSKVVVSPHRHAAADIDGTVIVAPPTPTTPPPTPSGPAAVRTVSIAATDASGWQFSYSTWRDDRFIQGGVGVGRYRPHWFYGGAIAAAKGSGTIIGGSIFVKRDSDGGVNAGAQVRLGYHGFTSRPGSGAGALSGVTVIAHLDKGQGATLSLPQHMLDALNAGQAGFGLEPGVASYTSPEYMPSLGLQAGAWSGQLSLTIQG